MKTSHKLLLSLTCILLLSHFRMLAQNVIHADYELAHGQLPTTENGYIMVLHANHIKDGMILYKSEDIRGPGGKRSFLEKYDKQMNRVSVREYGGGTPESPLFYSIFTFNDKLYALNGCKDKTNPENTILKGFISEINTETLEISVEREIFELKVKDGASYTFGMDISNDGKTLAVILEEDTRESLTSHFRITTLNQSLEISSNTEGDLTYGKTKGDHGKYLELFTLNSGKTIVVYTAESVIKGSTYNPILEHFVGMGTKDGLSFEPFDISNYQMAEVVFSLSQNEDFYAGGYYYASRVGHALGSQLVKFDLNSGTAFSAHKSAFTEEFALLKLSERDVKVAMTQNTKDGETGIDLLVPTDLVSHPDGSISLVGQVDLGSVRQEGNSDKLIVYPDLHETRFIHVSRFDANGALLYNDKMEKITIWTDDYFRYRAFDYNNDLLLFSVLAPKFFYEDIETLPRETRGKLTETVYALYRFGSKEKLDEVGKNTVEALYENSLEKIRFGQIYYESHVNILENGAIFLHTLSEDNKQWGILFSPKE